MEMICSSFIWVEISSVLTSKGLGPLVLCMGGARQHSYKFNGLALTLDREGSCVFGWRKIDLSSSTLGKWGAHSHILLLQGVISDVTVTQHCGEGELHLTVPL